MSERLMSTGRPVMEALRDVRPPRLMRTSVLLLLSLLTVTLLTLAFAPWQQTAVGTGTVIAYAPANREQPIEAPIDGLIQRWDVQEGERVIAGQQIGEIVDNDPQILSRLSLQRDAALSSLEASTATVRALERKIVALRDEQNQEVASARARLSMGQDRSTAAMRAVEAAQAALTTAELNLERQRQLEAKGLTSTRDREMAELTWNKSKADLERARMGLSAAQGEIVALKAAVDKALAGAQVELEQAFAYQEEARGKEAKAASDLASVDTRLSRQSAMVLTAPADGTVVRISARPGRDMVKAGDPLAIFAPDTAERAVQIFVDGNDAPLISPGAKARLQFEGWPAIQFSGWPSVAVGTFGGQVAVVDATIDANGQCRVMIVPDPDDAPWPEVDYLRQGVLAGGWLLLGEVSLGYEVWRRLNGFPPRRQSPPSTGDKGKKS